MTRKSWQRNRRRLMAVAALATITLAAVLWSADPRAERGDPSLVLSSAPPAALSAPESPSAGALFYQLPERVPLDLPVLALNEPTASLPAHPEPAPVAPVAADPVADEPAAPTPRLATLPFRTQRDGSRWAGSNCGPAALAMVLEAWGLSYDNDYLRYLTHTYQGTWGRRGGTALEHMAQVADDFGVRTSGLYAGDEFRRWRLADVRAEVAQGRPVIALVKYRLLPGRENSTVRFDHYVVLWDVTPNGFVYNDPIYPEAHEGYARFMTNAQLEAAMRPTLEPQQAVAFVGPSA
jgi:hypothetical protein